MPKSFVLGVSVGESFAEYTLLSDSQPLAQKRVYLLRENLKQSLQQFLTEQATEKLQKTFVSLRVPKKLLHYQLGGGVAHLATEGFEQWLSLCEKSTPLTSKDLLFSVTERTLADGTIDTPLDISGLEAIAAKLQLVNCKRVCVHFMHAATNPSHQDAAKKFFQEKGFEVFTPEKTDNPNETSRWKRNALNATLSSVFQERKEELLGALAEHISSENVHFLSSKGTLLNGDSATDIGSFFSSSTALGLHLGKNEKADVLYLGLENFLLISGSQWKTSWESPWGQVELPHLQIQELGIQPTLGISLNVFQRFDFSQTQEGWEPGPMFLGRGQKPCLLDLWSENSKLNKLNGLEDRASAQGIQRFKNSLFALTKISTARDMELGALTKEMQSLTLQRLAMEACLDRTSEKMIVTGPLASVFSNAFKKDPHTTIAASEFSESEATALHGMKAL